MVSIVRVCSSHARVLPRVGPSRVLTKTGREQLCVEVGQELLALCIELAHSRDNVARRADAHDLHDGLKDEQREVGEVGVRAVGLLLEDLDEAAIVAVVERLRCHGDKVVGGGSEVAQAQGLGTREERHPEVPQCLGRNWKVRSG